jgi:hypothetical protein
MDEFNAPLPALSKNDPPQPKDEPKAQKLSADELVKKHLADFEKAQPEDHPEPHRLVAEHCEEAKLETWQRRCLLARFHAHGLHIHSRIHPDVFKAALNEALFGRV